MKEGPVGDGTSNWDKRALLGSRAGSHKVVWRFGEGELDWAGANDEWK